MTWNEAYQKMQEGHKVRHEYFSDNEWMMMHDGKYKFEDGVICNPYMFWIDRAGVPWQTGWSVVTEEEKKQILEP